MQADFTFFFDDAKGRRLCYLAPERFVDALQQQQGGQQGQAWRLTPAMDVFSLGCVLAELFLNGIPLFDLGRVGMGGSYAPVVVLHS